MRAVPRLCKFYPGICLTTEEKARKNLSQGSRRVLVYILPKHTHITEPIHTHTHKLQNPHIHTHPHITKQLNFFLWGLNQDGREVAWALCVHDRRANTIAKVSYCGLCIFMRSYSSDLWCRSCNVYHARPTRTTFHLFWHCWLGAGWAVHCGKMRCQPQ